MGPAIILGIPGVCPEILHLVIAWLDDAGKSGAGSVTRRSPCSVAEQNGGGFPSPCGQAHRPVSVCASIRAGDRSWPVFRSSRAIVGEVSDIPFVGAQQQHHDIEDS
jgi:hypothetical protein